MGPLSRPLLAPVQHRIGPEMIAIHLRIKGGAAMFAVTLKTNGAAMITTAMTGRVTISAPRIVTTSAPTTRGIFGNGANIPRGGMVFAPVNGFRVESL